MFEQSSIVIHLYVITAIILLYMYRNTILSIINPTRYIINEFLQIIPFVDPDSARAVEWITFHRQRKGLSTYSKYFDVPGNVKADYNEMCEIASQFFKQVYKADNLFRGLHICKKKKIPDLYLVIENSGSGQSLSIFGDHDLVVKLYDTFNNRFSIPDSITIKTLTGFGPNGPIENVSEVVETSQRLANDTFYPFIDGGIEQLAKRYAENPASVLLLIGPWGTGKSTLARTLMFLIEKEVYAIANGDKILLDASFNTWLASQGDNAMIVTEDSDQLVAPRADGNSQMSALLNYAEGVLSNSTKMIISTNLPTKRKIDPALIRPGRCFEVIEFRKLTLEEANLARQSVGLDPITDLHESDIQLSLTEALNYRGSDHFFSKPDTIGFY